MTRLSHLHVPAVYKDRGAAASENLVTRYVGWKIPPGATRPVLKRDWDAISGQAWVITNTTEGAIYAQNDVVLQNQSTQHLIVDDGGKGIDLDPSSGTNEVQTITVNATAGTFTATVMGQTTGAMAFNITAADMVTAFNALSNIAPGDVTITGGVGGAGGGTPYTITFRNTHGQTNIAPITTNSALLTGGTATATAATLTPGEAGKQVTVKSDASELAESSSFAVQVDVLSSTAVNPEGTINVTNISGNVVIVEEVGRHRGSGIKVPVGAVAFPIPRSAWDSDNNNFTGILTAS